MIQPDISYSASLCITTPLLYYHNVLKYINVSVVVLQNGICNTSLVDSTILQLNSDNKTNKYKIYYLNLGEKHKNK